MYMTLLGLFSYIVLVELSPIEEQWPSKVEYITYVWVSTMIAEEIRQVGLRYKYSVRTRIFVLLVLCLVNKANDFSFLFLC